MNKCVYKGIDIFNPLEGNMKYFINAFTKVYGEKYRGVIDKRLNNAKYFFLGGSFETIIETYKERQQEEIDKVNKQEIPTSLKKLKIKEITMRYQHIIKIFENSIQKSKEIETRYSNARADLLAKYIQTVHHKNKLTTLSPQVAKAHINTLYELLTIGSETLKSNKLLFSEQKKQQYIALFNALGYKAKDFDAYLKNKKLIYDIFDLTLLRTLNSWNQSQNDECFKANICTADLVRQLDNLDLYGGSNPYIKIGTDYILGKSNNSAFAINCLSKKTSFTCLCFCKNGIELNIDDLTHEMGHIIDSFVVQSSKQGFYHKSGFELHYFPLSSYSTENDIVPEFGSKDYRLCELFNEMVNEYICLQVAKEIKSCGKTIVFGERKGRSKYEYGFEIFEGFLKKYQDKLIDFKMAVDKQDAAKQYFGEQNFKDLAVLAKQYIEKRSELNLKLCNRVKGAPEEIAALKVHAKQKLAEIEKRIEKHMVTNSIYQATADHLQEDPQEESEAQTLSA